MATIADEKFISGSIKRRNYKHYNKRFLYRYRDVIADMVNNNDYVFDGLFEEMYRNDCLSKQAFNDYNEALLKLFKTLPDQDDITDEEWYEKVLSLRKEFSNKAIQSYIFNQNQVVLRQDHFGIDDRDLLLAEAKNKDAFLILIDECKYIQYIEYIKEIKSKNSKIIVYLRTDDFIDRSSNTHLISQHLDHCEIRKISSNGLGFDLNTIEMEGNTLLIGLGEWCLSSFRNLNCDSFVFCESKEINTRCLTNSIDKSEHHCVYIPKSFDAFKDITIVEKFQINLRVFHWLRKSFGVEVYFKDVEVLKANYPTYFINVYSDRLLKKDVTTIFKHTTKSIQVGKNDLLNQQNQPMKLNYLTVDKKEHHRIQIKSYANSKELRQLYRNSDVKTALISNFLFFATEKMLSLYNKIRKDRPCEQYHLDGWHLDHMKEEFETFPLYNKAMIGLTNDDEIIFKHHTLEGGSIEVNGQNITWSKAQVNTNDEQSFKIYTPYYYGHDTVEYFEDHCFVGHDRINMIIVNREIVTVRKGEVILPNIGVVLSFDEIYFNACFSEMTFDENGYNHTFKTYDLSLDTTVNLKWAYSGGMFLVNDYNCLDTKDTILDSFRCEGWLSNLSKQTQDSPTFQLDRHPRSGIGLTGEGKFFIMTISGRSINSVGANYFDMIHVAKETFGEVAYLMNVDGGASSVLAAVTDSEVIALNDITYTNDSCAGTLRPLNSMIEVLLD